MQIVIPMTGYGSRFVAAGYKKLKPFIEIDGKSIIQWIIDGVFPEEKEFLFVCRKEHLNALPYMKRILEDIAPDGRIYVVDDWIKKGPVYDVLCAKEAIKDDEPVIINYCDFYMIWDWKKAKAQMLGRGCDGCIPCYTGFHPHLMVSKNVYASCQTDEDGNLIEIREKHSFESDKTKAKHSPGTYYFKTGAYLKKYCGQLIDSGAVINGEYYASMPYNFMVKDGLKVWVPANVEYFCQWGTPEDMRESLYWIRMMKGIVQ